MPQKDDVVAGVDEVGRGALAGPVVACACVLSAQCHKSKGRFRVTGIQNLWIADSKALSPNERQESALWLTENTHYGIGVVSQEFVDAKGIVRATEEAMKQALERLQKKISVTSLLVDGRDKFHFSVPHQSIVRGDALEPSIAAASILAKVFRDSLMHRAGCVFPIYGFSEHKGYGSE